MSSVAPASPTFRAAFRFWLWLGCVSFGGPAGQIAIMHRELVEKRRWISERRFLHALNYCMVLPGPEAQQLATYIGWLLHGTLGGIVAGALFVLPSLAVLVGLSWVYLTLGDVTAVAGALHGIKPAITAVVVFAAWRIGSRALGNAVLKGIALAAFAAIFALHVPFPMIILAAAALGWIGGRVRPAAFAAPPPAHAAGGGASAGHVIGDGVPVPPHARFSGRRLVGYGLFGASLWLGALLLLPMLDPGGLLTQVGWFFTKAALLTFGGAYAVLPYVFDAAVLDYHWLTAAQMMDGLALGETTPGPLIMIVAFVGFVAAWQQQIFGPDALLLAGILGASVATFFTFLPSFLFILCGAPAVEATHGDLKFTSPLAGITAAVVGVIVNLAVFFAYHVLWPAGFGGPFDWISAALCAAALVALFRFRIGIIPVILACALAGVAYRMTVV